MLIYVQEAILGPVQKFISYKYANEVISYMMMYVQAPILGPLRKEEKVKEKVELRMFHLNPRQGNLSQAPLPPLYDAHKAQSTLEKENSESRVYNPEPLVGLHEY